jgi:C4-dicarboxylate transporter DctQ subunit
MNRLIKKLNKVEEGVLGFSLLALSIVTFGETFLRYTFSVTFAWLMETANYSIIFFTYMGAAVGVKYATHFSMEALTEYAPDRVSHALKVVAYFLSAVITVFFIVYSLKHIAHVYTFAVKSPAMQLPMYIPYIPIPLFSLVMTIRLLLLSGRHLGKLIRGETFERVVKKS